MMEHTSLLGSPQPHGARAASVANARELLLQGWRVAELAAPRGLAGTVYQHQLVCDDAVSDSTVLLSAGVLRALQHARVLRPALLHD